MQKGEMIVQLFFTMLKIGLFTFGGGYAMIALLENEFVEKKKWLGKKEFLNIAAIAESTPGPIAINSATYIGYKNAGVLGSVLATLGVVLPSFIIILVIAALIRNLLKYGGVKAFLSGIRPCVVGLILATAVTMFFSTVFGFSNIGDAVAINFKGLIIFAIIIAVALASKILFKKKPSPILMILFSAVLGMLLYGI